MIYTVHGTMGQLPANKLPGWLLSSVLWTSCLLDAPLLPVASIWAAPRPMQWKQSLCQNSRTPSLVFICLISQKNIEKWWENMGKRWKTMENMGKGMKRMEAEEVSNWKKMKNYEELIWWYNIFIYTYNIIQLFLWNHMGYICKLYYIIKLYN